MPTPETATITECLQAPINVLLFAPLGQQGAHAVAVQGVLQIDPRSTTPAARLLLHELLHCIRPMWSETRVRQWESKLWRQATWKQKAKLYRLLGKGVIWNGDGSVRVEYNGQESPEHPRADTYVSSPPPAGVHDPARREGD